MYGTLFLRSYATITSFFISDPFRNLANAIPSFRKRLARLQQPKFVPWAKMATVLGLVSRAGRSHIAADLNLPREVLGRNPEVGGGG
jgi:hypothetical protein